MRESDTANKLREKLAVREALQVRMREANKLVRKQDRAGLIAMGFDEEQADGLLTPDYCHRLGFPAYCLVNNNAEIRRIKNRLARLETAEM